MVSSPHIHQHSNIPTPGLTSAPYFHRQWFTFCFVPLIPFSLKPYHDVSCHVCNFNQDIKYRPDVEAQMNGAAAPAIPMQNQGGHQGWSSGPPPRAPQQEQQQYQSGGPPAYK